MIIVPFFMCTTTMEAVGVLLRAVRRVSIRNYQTQRDTISNRSTEYEELAVQDTGLRFRTL